MIIDQLFTQPIFEAADPNKLIVSVTILPMSAEDDTEVKDFDLTGRFQGDARSQINQATAYLTKFFEARGINFTNFRATYQGQIITQQNVGSMEPQNDAERELQTMANQMRNKRPGQNATPALKEFAPSDDGEGPNQEELLRRLAAHWWNGNERQMAKVENTLAAMGWEIGQDEGYDDGGVFVVRAGDEHGRTYTSWSADELEMNEAAPPGARAERMVKHIKQGYARDGKLTPKEKGIAFATAWKAHNAGRVEEGEITKNATGLKHRATDKYGAGDDEPHHYTGGRSGFSEPGKYARDLEHVNKQLVKDLDASMGISWKNRGTKGIEVDEAGVSEGEYDSRKPFGVRYKVFAGREGRMTTREYWTSSEEKLQRAVEKIQALDNFYEIDGYSYPKESQGVTEGSEQKPAITYKDYTLQYDYQTEDDDPEGYSTATTYYFDVLKDGDRVGEAEYFDYFGNLTIRINGKTKEFGFRHPLASQISQLVSSLPDEQKKDLSDPRFESQDLTEVFADQGSGSTDRDNADYMKRRNAAKKKGYTGRETKAGTWRVFKDGNAVAAAGPFKSADEAAAWIKKHKQGITEMDKSEPSAGRDTGPRPGPDREAKPITAKKATRDAGRMLNRAVKDAYEKKDVKEGLLGSDPNRGQKVPDWAKGGIIGKIGRKLDPAWSDVQMTVPQHLLSKQSSVPVTNSPATKDMPKDTSITPTRAIPQRAATAVPPTFPANTNARGGGVGKMNPDPLAQLMRESGIGSEPLMLKLRRALVQEGRVKELADDLKTMRDADFMKKYGKAKAAIRRDMKRVDEAAQTNYTPQEMADILSGKKTQQQVDAERAKKIDDQTDDLVMRVDKQGRRVDKNGKLLPPPKTWTNPPINPPPGNMQQYEGLNEQDAAGQQFVGTGTSSNWQMSVNIAAMNAKRKAAQSIAGTNNIPNGVLLPPGTTYGPQDTKSDGTGKYVSTYTITLPAPSQSAEPAPTAPGAALDSSPATGNMKGSMSTGAPAAVGPAAGNYMKVNELSTNKLSQYKTAAAKDAKKADQAGDFKRGDKRLGGMVQATKKQFDNDAKKVDESRAARRALMARIVNAR